MSELLIIESTFSLWMLVKGKLECNWHMHITCILILNVFIAISTIKMNARGNTEWLTSYKLCYNLFKKFKFRMRQSKCCCLIGGKTEGDLFECSFPVSSQGAFATLLWLAWVTPLLSVLFLIKALGLELKDFVLQNVFSFFVILSASVICSVFCLCLEGLCGTGERSIRSVPPSQAGLLFRRTPEDEVLPSLIRN